LLEFCGVHSMAILEFAKRIFLKVILHAFVAINRLRAVCDTTNESKAFAWFGLGSGIGAIIGPSLGGWLAQPASKYALLDVALFRTFPFLLPCMIGALVAAGSFVAAFFFLKETVHEVRLERSRSIASMRSRAAPRKAPTSTSADAKSLLDGDELSKNGNSDQLNDAAGGGDTELRSVSVQSNGIEHDSDDAAVPDIAAPGTHGRLSGNKTSTWFRHRRALVSTLLVWRRFVTISVQTSSEALRDNGSLSVVLRQRDTLVALLLCMLSPSGCASL
jgi:hypothetical protein